MTLALMILGIFLKKLFSSFKDKGLYNNITGALPFMDDEDIHELVLDIINNEEKYKNINLCSIMPFLKNEDCDLLFFSFIKDARLKTEELASIAPFVSNECLSKVVDEYINGNYSYLKMDVLYPFMNSKDVKKLFNYF